MGKTVLIEIRNAESIEFLPVDAAATDDAAVTERAAPRPRAPHAERTFRRNQDGVVPITVLVSERLRDRLKVLAQADYRSLSQMAYWLIERGLIHIGDDFVLDADLEAPVAEDPEEAAAAA